MAITFFPGSRAGLSSVPRPLEILMAYQILLCERVSYEVSHITSDFLTTDSILEWCSRHRVSKSNKEDKILEPFRDGELVFMYRPEGVVPESTYMYACVF